MFWLRQNKKKLFFTLFLVLLFLGIFPLFKPGFFQSDDAEWMIIRFSAFHQTLRSGQFPVRFLARLNHGYGYPVANFLYPGFMYIGEIIHILGFNFQDSIKIILGLSMVFSGIFSYFWLNRLFGFAASLIGSLFYLYTPYHFFDLYNRGSVGEVLALSIVPFIFWQIERKNFFWLTVGIAALVLSHNSLALLFLPIVIGYGLLRNLFPVFSFLFSIILGFGLSSFFWLPAVFELTFTNFSNIQVSNPLNYFSSFNLLGLSSIFVLILSSWLFLKSLFLGRISLFGKFALFFLALGSISIFLATPISSSIWKFSLFSFIQFPFRILSLLILSVSFLSGYVIQNISGVKRYLMSIVLLLALFYSASFYFGPKVFFNKQDSFYSTNEDTTTVQDEYMPRWVKIKPDGRFRNKVQIIQGEGSLSNVFHNSKKIEFDALILEGAVVRLNTIYYPGWRVLVNGKETDVDFANDLGVIEFFLAKGEHKVKVQFLETPFRMSADFVSLTSFILLIIFSFRLKKSL